MNVRIVGLGAVTALGRGADALWEGALSGATATARPRRLQLTDLQDVLVGEAPDPERSPDPAVCRALELARIAAAEAMTQAGWAAPDALVLASTKGGIGVAQRVMDGQAPDEALRHGSLFAPAERLGAELGAGMIRTVSVACASGTSALGYGRELMRRGAERVLVVGADGLCEFIVRGFAALRALARGQARPFDARRSGLNVGEGAAAIALERGDGPARAHLIGYGGSNDANHITGPARDGAGLVRAVRAALSDAGRTPEEIAAVSAHGTATSFNDAMEGQAWTRLLDGRRVPTHSIKGAIGHTLGAAGVVEAVLAVRGLETGLWPPIAGLEEPDPEIPVDPVVGRPRELCGPLIVSSSSGFAGINSAVVLCR